MNFRDSPYAIHSHAPMWPRLGTFRGYGLLLMRNKSGLAVSLDLLRWIDTCASLSLRPSLDLRA